MSRSAKRASFCADLDLLRSQFDALDPRKSGYIGYSELTKLVQSMQGFEESMVPELMTQLDRDKDGKVRVNRATCRRGGVSDIQRPLKLAAWRPGWYVM